MAEGIQRTFLHSSLLLVTILHLPRACFLDRNLFESFILRVLKLQLRSN